MCGPTPGKKVFRVHIDRTQECDLLIEGDSKEDVIAAVEDDDFDNRYHFDYYDRVTAYEFTGDPAKLPKDDQVLHGVLDEEVHEIDSPEYQAAFGPKAPPPPPPPDTETLPLFPEVVD